MAARKKRRRRIGGPIARRWFAVGALVLVGLLYYRPLHDYFDARSQRAVRVAAVRKLQREQAALEKRLRRASSRRGPRAPRRGRSATSARASTSSSSRTSRSGGAGSMEVMLPAVVTDADRAVVARQLGREPRTLRRVAVRCPFGAPAVTEQSPYGADGEPFPTTYYLTCRHLVAAVSRLEAAGGVERWSEAARAEPALAASLAAGDEEQRRLRTELAGDATGSDGGASLEYGIGGSRRGGSLKCLHAHAAFALARPGYELGERILAEVEPRWPERCCSMSGP